MWQEEVESESGATSSNNDSGGDELDEQGGDNVMTTREFDNKESGLEESVETTVQPKTIATQRPVVTH